MQPGDLFRLVQALPRHPELTMLNTRYSRLRHEGRILNPGGVVQAGGASATLGFWSAVEKDKTRSKLTDFQYLDLTNRLKAVINKAFTAGWDVKMVLTPDKAMLKELLFINTAKVEIKNRALQRLNPNDMWLGLEGFRLTWKAELRMFIVA